jgi:GxxExxY protein
MGYVFEGLSYLVIGACIALQRQLGTGCMEIDYQRALELELPKRGISFLREVEIPIAYDGMEVTRRRVDFVVWDDKDTLLLEIKAARAIRPEDETQCRLYLRYAGIRVCLLVNFGQFPIKPQRLILDPDRAPLFGATR